MHFPFSATPIAAAIALAVSPLAASSAEVYGGIGTTGAELGVAQALADSFTVRLDANLLRYSTHFTTSGIDYNAKLKAANAGVYLDGFVYGGARVTGGALLGSRKYHGTATSLGNTVTLNGVTYPVAPGDGLDFDAKFPSVTPYLGLGYGHRTGTKNRSRSVATGDAAGDHAEDAARPLGQGDRQSTGKGRQSPVKDQDHGCEHH